METREVIAYVLCAVLALGLVFSVIRYLRSRRQFKIRQMGRGKNLNDVSRPPTE